MIENSKRKNNIIFGYFFSLIFFIVSVWPIFKGGEVKFFFLVFALILILITLFRPNFFTVPNVLWTKLGFLLGNIFAPIVMFFIYFLLMFPINLLLKIFKNDVMAIKYDKEAKTYWKNNMLILRTLEYEIIENIKPENHEKLLHDLENRIGLPITKFVIHRINFLRDTVRISIYCKN